VASIQDEEAKKRVQEATWQWTGRVIVLLVTFGFGVFAGYTLWGSGDQGALSLRPLAVSQEATITELKNKRVDLDSKLQVTQQRYDECQKALSKAAAPPTATP